LWVDPEKNLPWAELPDGLDIRGWRAGFTDFAATPPLLATIPHTDDKVAGSG